jgi:hypothetical protein
VLHNAAQRAANRLPVDIEVILLKMMAYFNGSTKRHELLKEYCEFVDVSAKNVRILFLQNASRSPLHLT